MVIIWAKCCSLVIEEPMVERGVLRDYKPWWLLVFTLVFGEEKD
jgi:hypothetical protein